MTDWWFGNQHSINVKRIRRSRKRRERAAKKLARRQAKPTTERRPGA